MRFHDTEYAVYADTADGGVVDDVIGDAGDDGRVGGVDEVIDST